MKSAAKTRGILLLSVVLLIAGSFLLWSCKGSIESRGDQGQETPVEKGTTIGHVLLPEREPCLSCHRLSVGRFDVTWPEDAPMQFPCRDCHRPHEAAKPVVDCLSCHAEARSQGMHARGAHAASLCQVCHKPHQWEVKGRETCLTCHPGKGEHNQPVACATCHSFQ